MFHNQFIELAQKLVGDGKGWKARIAERLGVGERSVRYWAAGQVDVPAGVITDLMQMHVDWAWVPGPNRDAPADAWIIGSGPNENEYLIHTAKPRFIAQIIDDEDIDDIAEIEGITYQKSGVMFCNIFWLDAPPRDDEVRAALFGRGWDAMVEWSANDE